MVDEQTMSNAEIADVIVGEGLEYAVRFYMGSTKFKDRKTAELWEIARQGMSDLEDHLIANGGEAIEDV